MTKPHGSFLPKTPGVEEREWHFYDDGFQAELPAVFELLAATKQDGKAREAASITLYVDQGRLKAVISDKNTRMSFFTTLTGSYNVLAEIDTALQEGRGEWRKQKEGWLKR